MTKKQQRNILLGILIVVAAIFIFRFGSTFSIGPNFDESTLTLTSETQTNARYSLDYQAFQTASSNQIGSKEPCPTSIGCSSPDLKHLVMNFDFVIQTRPSSASARPELISNLQSKEFKASRCELSPFGARYILNRGVTTDAIIEELDCFCSIKSAGVFNNVDRADLTCRFVGKVRTNNEPSPFFTSPVEFTGLDSGIAEVEILKQGVECTSTQSLCGFNETCQNNLCISDIQQPPIIPPPVIPPPVTLPTPTPTPQPLTKPILILIGFLIGIGVLIWIFIKFK